MEHAVRTNRNRPTFSDPVARKIIISWRRPTGTMYSNPAEWLQRFTSTASVTCPEFELIDVEKPVTDKMDTRFDGFTDLISIWTIEYAKAVTSEVSEGERPNELLLYSEHVKEGLAHGWVARLDPHFKREVKICHITPWHHDNWHQWPLRSGYTYFRTVFNSTPGTADGDVIATLDELIAEAIDHIKATPLVGLSDVTTGGAPNGSAGSADTHRQEAARPVGQRKFLSGLLGRFRRSKD